MPVVLLIECMKRFYFLFLMYLLKIFLKFRFFTGKYFDTMITYKAWTKIIIYFLTVFLLVNIIIWKAYTEDILSFAPYYNGGLDRMGYIVGSKYYRKPESTLPRHHIENREYRGQHVDVLTIGDSFFNIRMNGRDFLYQDWLATLYDLSILNIQHLRGMDELSTVVVLLNSGYLDKVRPRMIIIESVERYAILKFGGEIDFRQSKSLSEIKEYYKTAGYAENYPSVSFVNTGNFKFIFYNVLYLFSDNAFFSKVYVRDLNKSLFSVKKDKRLLFYFEDLEYIPFATRATVGKLNDNLNKLAALLRDKGIVLVFMPAADKYNMYSEYIINNPYSKSVFFELLRPLHKDYILVDTKAILSDLIGRGEKDVYYSDDTHWSWKAAKRIAEDTKVPFVRKRDLDEDAVVEKRSD